MHEVDSVRIQLCTEQREHNTFILHFGEFWCYISLQVRPISEDKGNWDSSFLIPRVLAHKGVSLTFDASPSLGHNMAIYEWKREKVEIIFQIYEKKVDN